MRSVQWGIKAFSISLFICIFTTTGFAADLTVPGMYPTIQGAIDAAVSGADTITVSPGTYVENINFNGKDIILTSTDPNMVAATIIDGNAAGSVVTFAGTETSACELSGFTITNGDAQYGGGILGGDFTNQTHATIANCTITGNTANYGGGLDWCQGPITHCTITGNTANYGGGGLSGCRVPITNCTISGNTAGEEGGGLYECGGPITNCTIVGNSAGWRGGGLCNLNVRDVAITNCIIWGNSVVGLGGSEDQLLSNSLPTYSCVQNWPYGWLPGNITSDPLFADTTSPDPTLWDLRLKPGSPCIDAGTNSPTGGLPATDIQGASRPFDGDVDGSSVADMGAYELHEFPDEPYLFVTSGPFNFVVQEAGSNPGNQTIKVVNWGNQTLNWSLDLSGKPDWLTITPTGGGLALGQSDDVTLSVDITGLSVGRYSYAFELTDPAAINSPQSILVELFIVLGDIIVPFDYPTIQGAINASVNGDTVIVSPGTYIENIYYFGGKDIILTSTDPTDTDIVATTTIYGDDTENVVTFSGSETNACQLLGFTITNGGYYGGVYGANTQATIENCVITGNTAYDGGGLAWCDGPITNCTITGNRATSEGGGLAYCNGPITNCTITGNMAVTGGGLAWCDGLITNCTITGNTAEDRGGGLAWCDYSPGPSLPRNSITNCIIWGNSAGIAGDQLLGTWVLYSCIQDWTAGGTGNITGDPLFSDTTSADPAEWDLHIKSEHGRWNPDYYETTDISEDGKINLVDFSFLAADWQAQGAGLAGDVNDDLVVDVNDLLLFCTDFLDVYDRQRWEYDTVTSPCIDAGDPNSMEWQNELWPHGGRVNMGAYGGTAQASMSANMIGNMADLDHDDQVGILDLELFSEDWLYNEHLLDTDLNLDGVVDIADLADFAAQWLWGL